jgi:hypothetical protein
VGKLRTNASQNGAQQQRSHASQQGGAASIHCSFSIGPRVGGGEARGVCCCISTQDLLVPSTSCMWIVERGHFGGPLGSVVGDTGVAQQPRADGGGADRWQTARPWSYSESGIPSTEKWVPYPRSSMICQSECKAPRSTTSTSCSESVWWMVVGGFQVSQRVVNDTFGM